MAKPTLTMPGTAKSAAPVAAAKQDDPAPYLGAIVIVKTSQKINGQDEHAAIVTQALGGDLVNVMLLPGSGQPYPIAAINRVGSPSWCWPPAQSR